MADDTDNPQHDRDWDSAKPAEIARLLRSHKGADALIVAIGMVQISIEATDEQAYAIWCDITDILCQEEGRAPFGAAIRRGLGPGFGRGAPGASTTFH